MKTIRYSHLNTHERLYISAMLDEGASVRRIAEDLDRSPSTISREIRRNSASGKYNPGTAQSLYTARKRWYGSFRNPQSRRKIPAKPRWRPARIPRTHICWHSDTLHYHRSESFWKRAGFPSRAKERAKPIFRMDDKPQHYRDMTPLAKLLLAHIRLQKAESERKTFYTPLQAHKTLSPPLSERPAEMALAG
ncbi:hypothetical protein FUAX_26010 [Fulvitalea axinellae]|uniref:Transposase IS30-like HTH domain-containing protein n=1 Tax=Fulvitalea axinellae TaxID=1182444 RepID=A0AAU9CDH2_9BACT|nr:hypothetical protein FUAX_26010 [Fulvitalea axinellae]